MQNKAIFPGTFDPITFGHIDLIQRAAKIFDEVIIAVAVDTYGKTANLDLQQRLNLVQEAITHLTNVKVISYHGLTALCAKEQNANVILRGLRASSEFDYEYRMATHNRLLAPEVETIFLATSSKYFHVSASLVRQIAQLKGDVTNLVPEHVAKVLEQFYSKK